jgi:hypothetical protein
MSGASFTVFQCIAELCAQFQNKEHVAPLRDNVGAQIKWRNSSDQEIHIAEKQSVQIKW